MTLPIIPARRQTTERAKIPPSLLLYNREGEIGEDKRQSTVEKNIKERRGLNIYVRRLMDNWKQGHMGHERGK